VLPEERMLRRRNALQRGLLAGYWSVEQFNHDLPPNTELCLPTWDFLDAHPRFADMFFRDMEAFQKRTATDHVLLVSTFL